MKVIMEVLDGVEPSILALVMAGGGGVVMKEAQDGGLH